MIVYPRYSYNYISTGATTQVATGTGTLHTITVVGGTAGTITIYDATSGTSPTLLAFDSTNAIATYTFDLAFAAGLRIVTSAATKLVVTYTQ